MTAPGLVYSVLEFAVVLALFVKQIDIMVTYREQVIITIESDLDLNQLGSLTLDEMDTIPFFSVYYEQQELARNSSQMCKQTKGDCHAFVK
jgi:hypothetical protein